MTPLLIVIHPAGQAPHVFWASDAHVIASSARLDDAEPLDLETAWNRYVKRHDRAFRFPSRADAIAWAETYGGDDWLAIRAEIARMDERPPNDLNPG